jgi:hypothetical protein
MGRRSRKRSSTVVAPPPPREAPVVPPPEAPRTATYKSRREDAPQPAWAPFPLTELVILLSIIMLGLGFLSSGDRRGALLGGGFVLVTLSAGELSLREHFAGYRSHSMLLAGIVAIVAAIPVWFLPVPQPVVALVGVIAFGLAVTAFRRAFMRRSGGVGFRT